MNIKTAGQIQTIDVTLSGLVTIDDICADHKYDDETVRASYYIGRNGAVIVTGVMANETRFGKPENWLPEHLPRFMTRIIERLIEKEVRERLRAA
jgi:hypothetical protein